jgi:hypothetical protein
MIPTRLCSGNLWEKIDLLDFRVKDVPILVLFGLLCAFPP